MSRLGDSLDIEPLWSITHGDPRVVIAILDGPVETGHACLLGARLKSIAAGTTGTVGSVASQRHGTHVTSEIFAKHGCDLLGIAPNCSGLLIPVFGGTEDGGLMAASQIDLARAIRLAVDRGANIINISGGQLSPTSEANQFLTDALAYCNREGVLVVAAVGNNGCECLHVPASIASVLAVGALDPGTGKPLGFSNWGAAYRNNGILAPGKDVRGAQAGGGLTTRSGTSFAAPIVTGVAALLMSLQLNRGNAADARAVRTALLKGAAHCNESVGEDCRPYLRGTLDVKASVGLLGGELDAVVPLQVTADLCAALPEARATICGWARHVVAAAGIRDAAESTELVEASSSREARESSLAEIEGESGPSVQPPDSNHSEERPASVPVRPLIEVDPTGAELRSGLHHRNATGEHMLNEQIDNSAARSNREAAEPVTSAGVSAASADSTDKVGNGVEPSGDCGCGAAAAPQQLVFVLGELGCDLVTEARKDSLWQAMHANPYDWNNLAKHLTTNPWDAEAVTWTLRVDATPIYAIRPMGPYAADAYKLLADLLLGQIDGERKIERISIPGWIAGSTTLTNGITVPVVEPSLRGVFAWDTAGVAAAVASSDVEAKRVANFLDRVYYELRNLGQSPQERAMNFAATNAFQISTVFHDAVGAKQELDLIEVAKSPICRQDSDCWDVKLTFFDPQNDRAARTVHRFTVDVSDVVPCTVGRVRTWFVR